MTLASSAAWLKHRSVTASFAYDTPPPVRSRSSSRMLGRAILATALGSQACRSPSPVVTLPPTPSMQETAPVPAAPPADLNADERILASGLARHVEHLAGEIGERHLEKSWELADAADYLAGQLEEMGYAVERQGYELGSVAAQNLAVTVRGGQRGDERFFVATHYDSPPESQGFQSALATAALLELARMMRGARIERTLRLVFFATGAAPTIEGDERGARHYARRATAEAERPHEPGLPDAVQQASEVENFGAFVLASLLQLEKNRATHSGVLQIPIGPDQSAWKFESILARTLVDESMQLSSVPLDNQESDARAMSEQGIPTVEIGTYRSTEPEALDGPSELDLDEAARVVMGIRRALGDILVEGATNDGMVTPVAR